MAPTEQINESAKTISDLIKERGLSVVLCIVLIGFVLWSSHQQAVERMQSSAYQREQSEKMVEVIASNTTAMESMAKASEATTRAVEALRMEMRSK